MDMPQQVNLENTPDLVHLQVLEPPDDVAPSVVDPGIDPTESLDCTRGQSLLLVAIGYIDHDNLGPTSGALYFTCCFLKGLLLTGSEHNRPTMPREAPCREAADAAGSTSNNNYLFVQGSELGHLLRSFLRAGLAGSSCFIAWLSSQRIRVQLRVNQ
ncbi:MAG TPA: hypothetical protein VGW38_15870 [Chloroflexota bacterium]|nr:hypothetical protein [Chloroflexota bacterium]